MEEQIKAELARISSEMNTQTIKVRRSYHEESGDLEFSLEADVSGLSDDEVAIAACVVSLRAEEAVLRNAHALGSLSDERFREEVSSVRQGFSKTVAQLVSNLLARKV